MSILGPDCVQLEAAGTRGAVSTRVAGSKTRWRWVLAMVASISRQLYNSCGKLRTAVLLIMPLIQSSASDAGTLDVPLEGLSVWGASEPTDAEMLAVRHLAREVKKLTGYSMPISWGGNTPSDKAIVVGNRATVPDMLDGLAAPDGDHAEYSQDIASQSFVAFVKPQDLIVAAGLGIGRTPRDSLGMSYAIGVLVESLDVKEGVWRFSLPDAPIVRTPRVPVRDLYVMGSFGGYPGLSIEQMSEPEMEDYVDFVVDARYSRVSFFFWREMYLYPDNMDTKIIGEERRAGIVQEYGLYTPDIRKYNENSHKKFRAFLEFAQRRGLEAYQMITPAHAILDLLPGKPDDWAGVGYYGATGGCWSKPEVREIAQKACQLEMEYFAPVDGYTIWFYDPAGCFCEQCKPNQADMLLDQFKLVHDLGKRISPEAEYAIGAAPIFVFEEAKFYTRQELDTWVPAFFDKCRDLLGGGRPMVVDHGENDLTAVYNGWVDPGRFRRQAMLYSTYGMMGEYSYVFPHVRFGYIKENAHDRTARHRLEGGMVMTMHNVGNRPGVWSVGHALYGTVDSWRELAESVARYEAKGPAYQPYLDILLADEAVSTTGSAPEQTDPQVNYAAEDRHISTMERAWEQMRGSIRFFRGSADQIAGFVAAQRWYWRMAKCTDESEFTRLYHEFTDEFSKNPVYAHYVTRVPSREDTGFQAYWVWRYYAFDRENKTGMAPVMTNGD